MKGTKEFKKCDCCGKEMEKTTVPPHAGGHWFNGWVDVNIIKHDIYGIHKEFDFCSIACTIKKLKEIEVENKKSKQSE